MPNQEIKLRIKYRHIKELKAYERNSRTHSKEQVQQIANSIEQFGMVNPIGVHNDGEIVFGHGRVEALKLLGRDTAPTVDLSHMSEAQKRAYVIADNKLALNAGWDDEMLALELDDLKGMDFDLDLTGFSADELDDIFPDDPAGGNIDDDAVPEPPAKPKSKRGDIWILGNHRLMCGDSTSEDDVAALMDGQKATHAETGEAFDG